ncbi:MAG TPA: phosphatidylglycerophosphatase A [Pyrinomonadaceae bacterium]|nr:phosphatidylglycerophosphatase A [Pyrinomonadaceae bacterium]
MRSIKESSDELSSSAITGGAFVSRAVDKRSLRDYFALAFATWGVGFIPLAPGTFGSAVGVGIFLLERWATTRALIFAARHGWNLELFESLHIASVLLILTAITFIGTWAATRVEKSTGRKDPGIVVVDEVAGQLVALMFLPFNASVWLVLAGFLLFRLFDIWKPYPIRKLESLESGLGIMADDILAGVYAAILLSLVTTIYLLF